MPWHPMHIETFCFTASPAAWADASPGSAQASAMSTDFLSISTWFLGVRASRGAEVIVSPERARV
jgi:hypothetical protein